MSLLNTEHEKKSFTLTTLLLSALLLVLFYIGLSYMDPPLESGISVNFGTTTFGMGKEQPKEKIKSQPAETKQVVEEKVVEEKQVAPVKEIVKEEVVAKPAEKILTQDNEESILIKQQQEAKRKADEAVKQAKAQEERVEKEKRDAEEKARQEKQAKKAKLDALMGGLNKSDGTAKGGEGDDNKAGDKGQPDGDPYATSYYGSPGSGSGGGGGFGLKGRSLVGKGKVQQDCNEAGRVVVKIVVDRNGNVVSAEPDKGTTNMADCLLKPAIKTAFMHKWNVDEKAPSQQVGFVIVDFKLGE